MPPVTAERSPPDSRITGADSPVIAASLTDAMPSITSPSPGMMSPGLAHHEVARLQVLGRDALDRRRVLSGISTRLARVSVRVLRSVSACALPRPSATASAKLANSTVNQSQITIWSSNAMLRAPVTMSRTSSTVVSTVTTSSTNITGFFTSVRGSSLTKAWPIAGSTIAGSSSVVAGMRLRSFEVSMVRLRRSGSEHGAGEHREMLDDRAERERGEEGQPADDQDHADQQADEQRAGGREGAARGRARSSSARASPRSPSPG